MAGGVLKTDELTARALRPLLGASITEEEQPPAPTGNGTQREREHRRCRSREDRRAGIGAALTPLAKESNPWHRRLECHDGRS